MSYEDLLRISFKKIQSRLNTLLVFLSISSILTAFSGFFVTIVCYNFLHALTNLQLCFAVFLMAFSVYSLNKISDVNEDAINMPERVTFVKSYKNFVIRCSIISYILSLSLAYINGYKYLLVLLLPIFINILYSSRPFQGIPRFKDIPIMKNVVTAVSWATVATLLPTLSLIQTQNIYYPSVELLSKTQIPLVVIVVFYFIFIKAFINTVIYDIRDCEGDMISGIKTIPVILGTQNTCYLLLGMNCLLLPCLIIMGGDIRIFMSMFVLYGFVSILYFNARRDPIYLDLFVEGEWMILYTLFVLLKLF